MIFVKNSRGGREVNMINTLSKINLSKINLSKIGWEGGRSTSIWIMSLNILGFFRVPLSGKHVTSLIIIVQKLGHFTNQILKICKIHRKLRVERTSVLFCKYLRNQSSDLYEILYGGQSLSCELKFQIS